MNQRRPGHTLLPDVRSRSARQAETLAPAWVRTLDFGFGGEPARAFNPSLIEWKGRLLLAHRRDWSNAHLWLAELDPETFQPRRVSPMHIPRGPHDAAGQEDPRLFVFRGKLHVSYTGVETVEKGVVTNVCLSSLDDEGRGQWAPSWSPQLERRAAWEKNWTFFDDFGDLSAVYSVAPAHRIIRCFHGGAEVAHDVPFAPPWDYGLLRGGAAPVLYGGEWYHFFHSRQERAGHCGYYAAGLYTFSTLPPFAPQHYCPLPLLLPEMGDMPDRSLASVVYPGGAVLRDDHWLLAYGEFDTYCRVACWPVARLEAALRPVGGGLVNP